MKRPMISRHDIKRLFYHVVLLLIGAQLVLMVCSWLYSAAYPAVGVQSLLSGEGLRWLMGRYAQTMARPLLVWTVLLSMAWGVATESGLFCRNHTGYRARRALWFSFFLGSLCVMVILLLSVVPHAVMRSVTGQLWPSPFSDSLVPMTAFIITLSSSVYGLIAGRFESLIDVLDSLVSGLRSGAPLLLLYVFFIQIYESLIYVLPINPNF